MTLRCCIAGCDQEAYTVYYGLMLSEHCYEAAMEAIVLCLYAPQFLENALCEFVLPNRVEDQQADCKLPVVERIHRALMRLNYWTEATP